MKEQSLLELPNASFTRRLIGAGVALTLLFALIAPQSSEPLAFLPRIFYWGLHIGLGLSAAALAARMLINLVPGLRDWRLVMLSGLIGVLMFAPIAYGLEFLFPVSAGGPDNDWSERFAQASVLAAIAVEAIEMAPSFLAAWALINLGPIGDALGRVRERPARKSYTKSPAVEDSGKATLSSAEKPVAVSTATRGPSAAMPAEEVIGNPFLDRLPLAIGRDVISVSSDLHYLQVVTRQGQAMVLGALQEVEDVFGSAGLRVHRSHWVHLEAVVRMRKTGSSWQLELVGGHCVPISRRRRSIVLASLGEDFVRVEPAT